jgi:small-conductance mechanosensitive channel
MLACLVLRFAKLLGVAAVVLAAALPASWGQEPGETLRTIKAPSQSHAPAAPVQFDGRVLFRLAPTPGHSADERARLVANRIQKLAHDLAVPPVAVRVIERADSSDVVAGLGLLVKVIARDAEIAGTGRIQLAERMASEIRRAIVRYRGERSPERLWKGAGFAAIATVLFALGIALVLWAGNRCDAWVTRRLSKRIPSVKVQSYQILRAEQVWGLLRAIVKFAGLLALLTVSYLYLQFVLGLFPWTRPIAERLLQYLLDPLVLVSRAVVAEIPSMILIVLIVLITRYGLKAARSFFAAIERGSITFSGFDQDWAMPTYRIMRFAVVAFAVVIAYPYVPGSESAAFKGMSIFLGIILSLGSTSVISNIIAGHTMTYRRAYKVGDRIRIQDTVGDVVEMHLLVTHLRTLKNEIVAVPNSLIMNSQVVNYTALAREHGLILHRTIGIGYDVPWRQVEAILLEAASRTPDLLKDPPPFVLQLGFGEFCINYELNVYCADERAMPALYTALDRNIVDVFNEYGVQIMTPAYISDPQRPKVVPKKDWHSAPAGEAAPRKKAQSSAASEMVRK